MEGVGGSVYNFCGEILPVGFASRFLTAVARWSTLGEGGGAEGGMFIFWGMRSVFRRKKLSDKF